MGKINVLNKDISELIAAGEVIERPASIVKELVENAIDAKASAITIEIKHGGILYIRISDNGIGMEKDDLLIAFKRHATSKISNSDDLDNIATLGFRGEALSSIVAVSKMEVISKTKDSQYATKILFEAGEQISVDDAGGADGTTMIVRDLFFNVPARLKFLKKDSSEANVIGGIVDKLALSHCEISFKFICDQKVKLHTPGNGDLLSAIHAVFGKEFSSALIPVNYEADGVKVTGFTSNTASSRSNRSMQHFFVNSRYVRSKTCIAALEEGYKNAIMIGKFPLCVLNVEVPFSSVDVNVHPAKIEVRFINERVVFDAVYFAVKSAIAKNDELTKIIKPMKDNGKSMLLSKFKNEQTEQIPLAKSQISKAFSQGELHFNQQINQPSSPLSVCSNKIDYKTSKATADIKTEKTTDDITSDFEYIKQENLTASPDKTSAPKRPVIKFERPLEEPEIIPLMEEKAAAINQPVTHSDEENNVGISFDLPLKIIGELFQTYILFEAGDNFIMLDKHAAHERIIFDKLKKTIQTKEKQILLQPIVTVLSSDEFNAIMSKQEMLSDMGFSYDEFGNHTIAIREVPLVLSTYDIKDIIIDIAQKLVDNKRDISSDVFENLLHSIACRSAIKAHDTNSIDELTALIQYVYEHDEIRHCPHGRPIITITTKFDIEKQFGRA